ncbi:MAG: hypothetical protein AABY22_32245 [Nanoarchaeota archaeon]
MGARGRLILIRSGAQEIGKSHASLKAALYSAYVSPHKNKTLLFDVQNEYGEYEIDMVKHRIKLIKHNEIIKFGLQQQVEVRRIIPFHPNGQPMSPDETEKLLIKTLTEFRGGTILIEDMSSIMGDNLKDEVIGKLCTVRHRNCDLVIHFQSIGRFSKILRQNAKIVSYHYQLDSILDCKETLKSEYEIFSIVEKLVNRQFREGNKYFHVDVYRMVKLVQGKFSERMFADACRDYVYEHASSTYLYEKRRNTLGKKMYTYDEAVKLKVRDLFDKYYGNVVLDPAKNKQTA